MRRWIFWIIYLVVFLCSMLSFTYDHESVHQAIYDYYGINSTIYFALFDLSTGALAYTIPDEPCPNDSCDLAQNVTEAVGYHAANLLMSAWLMLTMCLMWNYVKKDYVKKEKLKGGTK
jgi:hypothetical protein